MGTIQIAFLIAVLVSAGIEYLKGILPEKVKGNSKIMTLISGAISAVAGILYVVYAHITPIASAAVFVGIVVCFTQFSYELCFKTFLAIQAKLKAKVEQPLDSDKLADKVVDSLVDSAEKLITETPTKES